jgi:curved DNA-binding protein CbpA/Tfp pilus assembly protein PilF
MKSLYDVLGARSDDDAQALKKAFRTAVKAHHPDLHPDDPDAVRRFRRIVTANAILRDEKQRAAYDQLLELERQQIKLRLDHQQRQLRYERRQARLKWMGATAAVVVVCALAGGYSLFMPVRTAAIVAEMNDGPPLATVATASSATIVETIKKVEIAPDSTAAKRNESASTGAKPEVAKGDTDNAQLGTQVETEAGSQSLAHASQIDANIADDALRPGSAPFAADRGDTVALAPRTPALPNDANSYRELGIASYRIGDFPGAIVNLDEAIRLDPNDARAFNIRGNAWDEIGVFDNALADYDDAIRIDPNNPIFFHDRAIMWHRKGDLDRALVDLDRAIRFSFSDPDIYCDRGLIWYERGNRTRAIADFNQALKLDPNFTAAYISRGLILHRNSEFNAAFADLGRTILVSPSVFDVSRRVK